MFRRPTLWIALLALMLGLALLGGRGIWDPDEGRYTNVALNMLDSGDWLNPRRSDEVGHWTKPPLTYWAIASSVAVFGPNPWAARLPAALSYLLCVLMAWRIARRLRPGSEDQAALAYATMLFTVGAAHLITTDYVLAACSTLALWGFVEARFGGRQPRAWIALMWAGFGLAFMTKGPPGLLPLLAVLVYDLAMPGRSRRRVLQWSGLLLFLLLALPWYVAVILNNPGLFRYFIGDEVVNRVTTNEFGRHGQWYGWLTIYGPTLLVGTLPWTPALLRWARTLPGTLRRWRDPAQRAADAPWLLPTLWLLLPLLVFCLSRSRMPLYLLPLFAPLAVLVALQRTREGRGLPGWRRLAAWCALLFALQAAAAYWPTHKDASKWAQAIRTQAGGGPIHEVVFVEDMARYGLHLHLGTGTRIEKIALHPVPQSPFNRVYDELLEQELSEHEVDAVWVCKQAAWPEVRGRIDAAGFRATPFGAYRDRVLFRVAPAGG